MKRCLPFFCLLALAAPVAAGEAPSALTTFDDLTLRQAGIAPDAASLLKFLNEFARHDVDAKQLQALIVKLGSPQFEVRERASQEIIAIGRPALTMLRQVRKTDDDPEVRRRAGHCLEAIENRLDANVSFAAVRRLIHLQANGAAGPLLALLPFADSETQDEILHGLHRVALRDGKLDPALLTALEDETPLRRAAAALTVARCGGAAERERVRQRFGDAEPLVRLRAAQGLLAVSDPTSLPVLIALLNDAHVEISWSAEELLHWAAEDKAPAAKVGAATPAERKKAVAAWTDWHKNHAAHINWKQLEQSPRRPGLYFCCGEGCFVWLFGCDGKPRWQLSQEVVAANDILLLPNNQVLMAQSFGSGELVQRNLKGKQLWKYTDRNQDDILVCQRLANGNFFLATDASFAELGPDGRLLAYSPQADLNSVADARKLRNGRVLCLHDCGLAEFAGTTGALIRCNPIGNRRINMEGRFGVQADGHVVVADELRNRLLELNENGQTLRTIPIYGASGVEALRHGNYLVSTTREPRVAEVDADGRVVWEMYPPQRVLRMRAILDTVRIGFDRPRPSDFNLDTVASRLQRLKDTDPAVRRYSALFLHHLAPTDDASVQGLIAALDDPVEAVRRQVATTLAHLGPVAVPPLIQSLKHGSAPKRSAAAIALYEMGPAAKPAVPDLVALVQDEKMDREVRYAATSTLGSIGAEAQVAVPVLLKLLQGDDDTFRGTICNALPTIAPGDAAVIAGLLAAFKDQKHPMGQRTALTALTKIGPKAKAAVPDLLAAVQSPQGTTSLRSRAADALGSIGPDAKDAVAPLLALLKDSQQAESLRTAAARNLGRLGPDAKIALPAFTELLVDPKLRPELANGLIHGLVAMGKDGMPGLSVAVTKSNSTTKRTAITNLSQLGEAAKPALPALKEAMKDKEPALARLAQHAVRMIETSELRKKQMQRLQEMQEQPNDQ